MACVRVTLSVAGEMLCFLVLAWSSFLDTQLSVLLDTL